MNKEMICIVCPMSCHLNVKMENHQITEITGNSCPRGAKYAKEELLEPKRIVTSTVVLKNARLTRLPVSTSAPIPKNKIKDVMKQINKLKVKAPVKRNDILIENVCRTGVSIIATRSFEVDKGGNL